MKTPGEYQARWRETWPGAGRRCGASSSGTRWRLPGTTTAAYGGLQWPSTYVALADQLATHGPGGEEARAYMCVQHVWRGAGPEIVCGGRPARRAATLRMRPGPRRAALGSAAGRPASERRRTCERAGARHKRNAICMSEESCRRRAKISKRLLSTSM